MNTQITPDEGTFSSDETQEPAQPLASSEPLATRETGGRTTHLPEAAQVIVITGILRGDSNAMINDALVKAKYLRRGQSLSYPTLRAYRNDPRARVEIDRLSQEAIQAAHVALSDSLVTAVETFRAAKLELFSAPARFKPNMEARQRNSLVNAMYKAFDHLWNRIGRDDLLQTVLRAEQAMLDDLNKQDWMSPEQRKSIENNIKRQMAEMLRRAIALQQGQTPEQLREMLRDSIEGVNEPVSGNNLGVGE